MIQSGCSTAIVLCKYFSIYVLILIVDIYYMFFVLVWFQEYVSLGVEVVSYEINSI